MDSYPPAQGSHHAIVQWVEVTSVGGHRHYRIVYRIVNSPYGMTKSTVIPAEQVYRNPHVGDRVHVRYCLAQVLRIERAG